MERPEADIGTFSADFHGASAVAFDVNAAWPVAHRDLATCFRLISKLVLGPCDRAPNFRFLRRVENGGSPFREWVGGCGG